MKNWLDKYEDGGELDPFGLTTIKKDATTYVPPPKQLTKKQLEESKAKAKEVTKITNKANAKKLAERKKAVAESSDASIVNPNGKRFAIGDKFRLFPNDVSGVGEVFDNFINPAVVVGNTASALGNAMIDRDPKALAIEAGMALGAGALGFDPLGSAMKLPGKLDKVIYPTRTYRSVVPGGNKLSYESSELADKVFSKGDWTTRDLRDAAQYLSGNETEGGRRGLLTGNDMLLTEYKVPFWKKSVAYDPDVIALKQLQGDVPDPSEFIIPNNKFLYPRRTNLIKAVPENVKAATATNIYGEPFTLYQPGKGILNYNDVQYSSPAYKYIEDQLNAVTGQQMPYTFDFGDFRRGISDPSKMYDWKQPQFAPNEGMGSFSPFENGGHLDKYDVGGEVEGEDKEKYVDPEHTPSYRKVDTFINGLQDAVMNNPIVGPQVRGLAGLASGAYDLLETGIGKLYENKSQKEKEELFQKYRPIEYPSFGTAVARTLHKNVKPRMDDKGNYALEEEAWRKAMDLPVKSNYIRESKYKPTSAKDPNAKYYTLHPNVIDKQKLIDYANSDAWEKNKRMSKSGKEYLQMSSFAPFMNQEFLDRQSLEENQSAKDIDPLQRFQLYKGYDPKKKKNYISISDKYDFDFKPAKAVTKPYDIYDRFYYEDGGKVQENYNDYSVSAPEGFVGEGYSNVGRDYSPAWGGQFAMGGSMPGAVGFTYARVAGAAPSNGPYAKKTKASAQNGTEMRYYQEGLDWKPKTISRDGSQLVKLDQLTNFTNYNTKQPGGWLDKYEG